MTESDASRTDAASDENIQAAKISKGITARVAIDDAGRRLFTFAYLHSSKYAFPLGL